MIRSILQAVGSIPPGTAGKTETKLREGKTGSDFPLSDPASPRQEAYIESRRPGRFRSESQTRPAASSCQFRAEPSRSLV